MFDRLQFQQGLLLTAGGHKGRPYGLRSRRSERPTR